MGIDQPQCNLQHSIVEAHLEHVKIKLSVWLGENCAWVRVKNNLPMECNCDLNHMCLLHVVAWLHNKRKYIVTHCSDWVRYYHGSNTVLRVNEVLIQLQLMGGVVGLLRLLGNGVILGGVDVAARVG